ncbi:hypothetical protein LINPERPRIM_LOCUS4245 [Linum perenne]
MPQPRQGQRTQGTHRCWWRHPPLPRRPSRWPPGPQRRVVDRCPTHEEQHRDQHR